MFLHITTRIPGKKHDGMLSDKGGQGFPYLAWLDSNGDVLAKQDDRSIEGFAKSGKAVSKYVDLKARFDGGDTSLATELFLVEMDLGKHEYEAAKEKAASLKLTDEQKTQVDGMLFGLEIAWRVGQLPRLRRGASAEDQEDFKAKKLAVADVFQGYLEAGKYPADDMTAYRMSEPIMFKAMTNKDAALFEKVLARLKKQAGDNPMFARAWDHWDKQLEGLKGGGGF